MGSYGLVAEVKKKGEKIGSRSVLKNDFAMGGPNITDVECLNKALKLRQFLRAMESKHPTKMIQIYCLEKLGYPNSTIEHKNMTR